jgi:hypothetical protein
MQERLLESKCNFWFQALPQLWHMHQNRSEERCSSLAAAGLITAHHWALALTPQMSLGTMARRLLHGISSAKTKKWKEKNGCFRFCLVSAVLSILLACGTHTSQWHVGPDDIYLTLQSFNGTYPIYLIFGCYLKVLNVDQWKQIP